VLHNENNLSKVEDHDSVAASFGSFNSFSQETGRVLSQPPAVTSDATSDLQLAICRKLREVR
jgi:hypothetical protein